MKKIMLMVMLVVLSASSALALPWTQQNFGQLSYQPFNLIEGFVVSGEGFASGLSNFTAPGWQSDLPDKNYVRAWGPAANFQFWDAMFDGSTFEGQPMGVDIFWFFYNTTSLGNNPPDGQINELTYQTIYSGGRWQMYSSILENDLNFGTPSSPIPNMFSSDMVSITSADWDRPNWTVPVDQAAPVPEPSTSLLLGFGLISLAVYTKRRRVAQRI
jgi:hypothetical protein